jgi:uncharacterized protein (TIGR03000 family)
MQEVLRMYSMVLMMALTTGGEAPAFCHGCWGCGCGCWGGCGGCGCWGGCGGYRGCGGCYGGCCGGCYGGGCYGGGCYGGCGGCYGGNGGVIYTQPATTTPPPKKTAIDPNAATIVVSLPADAKLSIDDSATRATGATRTFATPTLEKGKEFNYTLKAEVVRNGQTLTTTKQVTVQAGRETRITLEDMTPAAAVAQK